MSTNVISNQGLAKDLKQAGFLFKKSLGQNFIFDECFLQRVLNDLELKKTDVVVEIGTGAGTLTRVLARNVKKIITYEVDKSLTSVLSKQFAEFLNIELVFADALKLSSEQILKAAGTGFRVVANIPYYITTPLILKFFGIKECREICVLVQDDVAKRIVAKPGGKDYGALSVTLQSRAECSIVKTVPRECFVPKPTVGSAFVRIIKTSDEELPNLEKLVKGLFAARRKTVLNGLIQILKTDRNHAKEMLKIAKIDENLRPEQLKISDFITLSHHI